MHDENQKGLAKKSLLELDQSGKFDKDVATKIETYSGFYLADDYHQDFYKHSAERYQKYKKGSGRADFIEENWAKEAAKAYEEEKKRKQEAKNKKKDYN